MRKQLLSYLGIFSFLLLTFQVNAQVSNFEFTLSGANEVPANASAGVGSGTATFDAATNMLSVTGNFSGLLGNSTVVHVHSGFVGINGPILITLNFATVGTTAGTFSGSGVLTGGQAVQLNASGLYINLHSSVVPSGELRGQLTITDPIPTLSEWGLIFVFFLLTTMGTLFIRRKQLVLSGTQDQVFTSFSQLPIDKPIYAKSLMLCGGILVTLFTVAIFAFGYEMTNADLPGSLTVLPSVAYFFHLLCMKEE